MVDPGEWLLICQPDQMLNKNIIVSPLDSKLTVISAVPHAEAKPKGGTLWSVREI